MASIDSPSNDKNLFAYCDSNPIIRADTDGDFWHIVIGAACGGLIGGVVKLISNYAEGNNLSNGLFTAMLGSAASGVLASTGVGLLGITIGNMAISMTQNAADQIITNKGLSNFNVGNMIVDGVIGGISGAIGGKGKGSKHLTNLGKQTMKRTIKTTVNKGINSGISEARKAFTYYNKNTMKYYYQYKKSLVWDSFSVISTTIATSNYMKYQYRRLLWR